MKTIPASGVVTVTNGEQLSDSDISRIRILLKEANKILDGNPKLTRLLVTLWKLDNEAV